jgi:Flp pilus assembly protein TadG
MKFWKLAIVVIVLGVIGLLGYDGVQVLNTRRDISDTASAAASAAAHAIATSKICATANAGNATKKCTDAKTAADKTAQSQGDVVTAYSYDAVAARVSVTVSGTAKSYVLHYFDRNLTDNIHASSSARPA